MTIQKLKCDIAKSIWPTIIIGIILLIIALYLINFKIIENPVATEQAALWGQFGDYFGGILNPIIAFAAFCWLKRSVKIQQKEINKLNEEIALTRALQEKQDARAEEAALISGLSNLIQITGNNIENLKRKAGLIEKDIYDDSSEYDELRHFIDDLKNKISIEEDILKKALEKQKSYVMKYLPN